VREESKDPAPPRWSRRRFLTWGVGGAAAVIAGGAGAVELVSHSVLPGKFVLDQLDGACAVASPPRQFSPLGTVMRSSFYSEARQRNVPYVIAYPPGHGPGSRLPLVVVLHAYGATVDDALSGLTLQEACALHVDGRALPPMALVAADGGNGYWHAHPGDDPMKMVVDELVPMCQSRGLGLPPQRIGALGISMGGYGALLLGEKNPHLLAAVAAISPAVWTSYDQARSANAGAYSSARDFAANDAVTQAGALAGMAVRVASGDDDPFHPGVEALVRVLPPGATVVISKGCHTGPFFGAQEGPSLAFLGRHLA
jgi:pimeloyl-ACP methyl ester carboxylesterase